MGATIMNTTRTPPPFNANPSIENLDYTAFLDLAVYIIYIKGTAPTKNKQPTLTGAIVGKSNDTPLKATRDSQLVVLRKIPEYARKSVTLTGLMNNLLGLAHL